MTPDRDIDMASSQHPLDQGVSALLCYTAFEFATELAVPEIPVPGLAKHPYQDTCATNAHRPDRHCNIMQLSLDSKQCHVSYQYEQSMNKYHT